MDIAADASTASISASLQRVASQSSLVQAAAPHHYHYIQYPAQYLQQQQQQPQQQCQCPCSCGRATAIQQQPPHQQQPQHQNASMAVAVLVHQQTSTSTATSTPVQPVGVKAQSAQSLLNHSYQALPNEENHNLPFDSSTLSSPRCECDLECSCGANSISVSISQQQHKRSLLADAMLGADEITVSESDNNSTMIKKKKPRNANTIADQLPAKTDSCNDIYHDTELEAVATAAASSAGGRAKSQGLDDHRPPLPPRPPPRPRSNANGSIGE
ncbi:hypothetical protein AWZ03_000079 [Drosophila navojoa]|uniref:Uncharacterized protein n=1 Tax=Drosophila navojoa TaxID=7232 RepID=A0A484BX62_DRONA|nr:hypothetical protein AWZ03_000079 [Drosophila navojoa]